ncbi:MAG: nitrite reductase (NAD(P)H) small subunit, partial [Porticoccaceae bacterium]|nr:nitrite reductase (NAD(P)H) small subunit [Porticoccaceae bacterium]
KQHFSLVTGKCLEDDSASVPVYEVVLDGDTVLVEV